MSEKKGLTPEEQKLSDEVQDKLLEISMVLADKKFGTVCIGIQYQNGNCETFSTGNLTVARGLCETLLEYNMIRMEQFRGTGK